MLAPGSSVPQCPVCTEMLGTEGGPCTLPCGHNGCVFCLRRVQDHKPECPLCRQPFPHDRPLQPNPVLRQLVTSMAFNHGAAEEDGWEAVPTRAHAVRMYASDLHTNLKPPSEVSESCPAEQDFRGSSVSGDNVSAQLVVRDAAARQVSMAAQPLSIITASCNSNRGELRYSYEAICQWVPPQWMPDSCAPVCKACCRPFKPLLRLRHHCRLCGSIFCHDCSSHKLLMPPKFGYQEPQRVCDGCYEVLKPSDLQNALAGHFSRAAQLPIYDVTDWTSLRAWVNSPLSNCLEQDIYKCANILGHFVTSSRLHAERAIPAALLQKAAGYAILSVLRLGCGWSATVGSGVVVARRQDGSWSPPSAVGLGSLGWGLQAGGEMTDLLLVLNDVETVKAFCGDVHLGVSGNVNVTVGPVGRDCSASICFGRRFQYAMVYSYSCSRGAFLGISLDGLVMHTRTNANLSFYGRPLSAMDLLLRGTVDPPPAARTLYAKLDQMMMSFQYSELLPGGPPAPEGSAPGVGVSMEVDEKTGLGYHVQHPPAERGDVLSGLGGVTVSDVDEEASALGWQGTSLDDVDDAAVAVRVGGEALAMPSAPPLEGLRQGSGAVLVEEEEVAGDSTSEASDAQYMLFD